LLLSCTRKKEASRKGNESFSFIKRRKVKWGRKEKQESEIGQNLGLGKRKKEKMPARRKNSLEMKDDNQDRLR